MAQFFKKFPGHSDLKNLILRNILNSNNSTADLRVQKTSQNIKKRHAKLMFFLTENILIFKLIGLDI